MCGGTDRVRLGAQAKQGLSPRVRGNPAAVFSYSRSIRSIPACAGEPAAVLHLWLATPVYPRVCGGTMLANRLAQGVKGLSPRVRGNHRQGPADRPLDRSIPACAGEPTQSRDAAKSAKVYPRVCGGTPVRRIVAGGDKGLSPRVRGNLVTSCSSACFDRSIPACAGEPFTLSFCERTLTVYPRVCGGTALVGIFSFPRLGLSPRVRGNRIRLNP